MNYLVTGATGFIGSNVVEQLTAGGNKVIALSNVSPSALQKRIAAAAPGETIYVRGDVRDQAGIEALLDLHGVDRMIHAAAITSNAERERTSGPAIVDVNLRGAAAAASAAGRKGLARFVLVSSVGVYSADSLPDGMIVDEGQPHRAETLYRITKSAAEMIVSRICALNRQSFVIGRVGTAFGRWEHDSGYRDTLSAVHQITALACAGTAAKFAHDKKNNWHYGPDAAAALITLAQADATRFTDYNLGPQWAWRLSEWCDLLKDALPNFHFEIGGESNVELYSARDGGLLSWARFTDEFGPTARFDVGASFTDYMEWLLNPESA